MQNGTHLHDALRKISGINATSAICGVHSCTALRAKAKITSLSERPGLPY